MKAAILFLLFITYTSASLRFYKEGENATLQCSADNGEVLFWLLKGEGAAIDRDSSGNIFINNDGSLQFQTVSREEHEGTHVCIVQYQEKIFAHTVEMDVRPLPPSNLWEAQYRGMFLTGFVAAFVCLTLFAGFCIVQKYRWKKPLSKVENPNLVNNAYDNPAMSEEGEENIKM